MMSPGEKQVRKHLYKAFWFDVVAERQMATVGLQNSWIAEILTSEMWCTHLAELQSQAVF